MSATDKVEAKADLYAPRLWMVPLVGWALVMMLTALEADTYWSVFSLCMAIVSAWCEDWRRAKFERCTPEDIIR